MHQKFGLIAACVLLLAVLVAGCGSPAGDPQNIGKSGCASLQYGKGLYYFPCTQADFGNALFTFRSQRPGAKILAIAGDETGGYGRTIGYFVVTDEVQEK